MTTIPSQLPGPQIINQAAQERDTSRDTVKAGDFMQLLVTQLTNQDPLDPVDDKEFMAQMAQFSSLEEMSSLNTTMSDFTQQQQAASASAYLGRDVTILGEDGSKVEGSVTAISLGNDGRSQVTVDGKQYDARRVQQVRLAD